MINMGKVFRSIIFVSSTFLLTGCIATYTPPQSNSETARLRVAQASRGVQTMVLAAPEGCLGPHNSDGFGQKIAILEGSVKHLQTQSRPLLGMPLPPVLPGDMVETTVLAGKPFSLAVNFTASFAGSNVIGTTETYCITGLQFIPEAGADYEAMFNIDGRRCSLSLTRLAPHLPAPSRVPVRSEPLKSCSR